MGRERSSHSIDNQDDFRRKLSTIYVGNLHPRVDIMMLWTTFKDHGRVRDVYLPRRRTARGAGFAFMRFGELREAERVAETVNGMHMYGWPIKANVAIKGWQTRRAQEWDDVGGGRIGRHKVGMEKVNMDIEAFRNRGKSFAEVVANDFGKEKRGSKYEGVLNLEPQRYEMTWLTLSLVGVSEIKIDCRGLEEELHMKGWAVKVAPLSALAYLCSFDNAEDRESFKASNGTWMGFFKRIFEWETIKQSRGKATWMVCEGWPLEAWNDEAFKKVGDSLGLYAGVDECTERRRRLDRVRMLIYRYSNAPGPWIRKVKVGDEVFQIRVSEESPENEAVVYRKKAKEDSKLWETRSSQVEERQRSPERRRKQRRQEGKAGSRNLQNLNYGCTILVQEREQTQMDRADRTTAGEGSMDREGDQDRKLVAGRKLPCIVIRKEVAGKEEAGKASGYWAVAGDMEDGPFKFYNYWLNEPGLMESALNGWTNSRKQ